MSESQNYIQPLVDSAKLFEKHIFGDLIRDDEQLVHPVWSLDMLIISYAKREIWDQIDEDSQAGSDLMLEGELISEIPFFRCPPRGYVIRPGDEALLSFAPGTVDLIQLLSSITIDSEKYQVWQLLDNEVLSFHLYDVASMKLTLIAFMEGDS